jgi:Carboxypeptidase regulatory-like domain/TonB-dependent Receptor Plug Domain
MKKFSGSSRRLQYVYTLAWLLAAVLALYPATSSAQQLTGTISGTAYDQSGAVVPKAQVVLKNEASGDLRTSVTESDGHFVITAVQPGSYTITISAQGFSSWQENGIAMSTGDNREIPNIKLNVGGNATQVNVVAGADAIVPTDTAEISTSINQQMINQFPLQGRDAGELIKIMPGMALNNGSSQGSGFNDKVVGTNNGPAGAYSSNGTQPYGTLAYMLDGANLVDPGNDGTQIANINPDMVSNIKVLISNYGAEYAKGPVIFQAFSRSGGSQFHGEGYFYTHNEALNSVDAFTNSQGPTAIKLATQSASYYYMGGNVGGPIIFPHFGYNKNRNKLFFWGGYEYMKQQPAGTPVNFNTPNTCQLGGDFSNTTCSVAPAAISTWTNFYSQLTKNVPAGGTATSIPTSSFDPNILGVLKLYPTPNETPSSANGYNNFNYVPAQPQNRWEVTGKVDYAISDNDKVTGSYTYQREHDIAPISIWWSAPWTLPYPSPAASTTNAYVILTNYTHVFNPTTTNEFVFTWSHFVNPYVLSDPSKVSRTTNGFNVQGLFGHTTSQIPAFEGPWGGVLANLGSSYSFSSGSFGGKKQVPAYYDNFTKIVGEHTLKAGFYWDSSQNTQNNTYPDMGIYNFAQYSQYSTNNLVADLELGRVSQYQQQNYAPIVGIRWHQWSIYGQDSWKAAKSLTLNMGMRFDHIGNWYGTDFQVWDPTTYVNSPNAPNNTGLAWQAINPKIPNSGMPSKTFQYAPRLGLAYDIFGNGKTVFRGGWGAYFYQASTEVSNAATGPLGSFEYGTPQASQGYASISNFTPPSTVAQNGGTVYGMQMGDSRVPFTYNWNATISQALPWRTVMELSYIGNRSANEWEDGTNSNIYNINNVPVGGFFGPDPTLGYAVSPNPPPCGATPSSSDSLYCTASPQSRKVYSTNFTANDFRPLVAYQNVYLLTHTPYSKYNGFQASFQKQSGPVTFIANYTFSKVLGIRDGGSNNGNGNGTGVDPFIVRNNYGPLAYDHTNILNFTYNWALPNFIHAEDSVGMKILGGTVNGWTISGYTAFQNGAPLQPTENGALNVTYASGLTVPTVAHPDLPDNSIKMPNGLVATSISGSTYFGSSAYTQPPVPALSCNPLSGLRKVKTEAGTQGMRFNPACFTVPAYGTQGPVVLPYMRQPNYWDSDLGIYKNFHITESMYIQFRASATNWLNHPLGQFALANNSDISLNFQQSTPATCTGCSGINVISSAPTNQNVSTTGAPAFKTGSRFVTLALKFYF